MNDGRVLIAEIYGVFGAYIALMLLLFVMEVRGEALRIFFCANTALL